ncbi:MAG TPA: heparinase II/III family protein [Planctomycetota bacterium]|nr:heparinase II/III family protein [Planctomycetota bacterium]
MDKATIRREVRRRADGHLADQRLSVDYYRIRRRISFPLPVRGWKPMSGALRGITAEGYPWPIWLLWALEERVDCLGWAAEWFADRKARAACERDLAALARWPAWRQYAKPDLSLGHAARTLHAATRWRWPSRALRTLIHGAFARMLDDGLPYSDRYAAQWRTKQDILALADITPALHNIWIIGTIGLALAARAIGHPALAALDARLAMVHAALLDSFANGFSEGVSYDGYTLDFLAQWLEGVPDEIRAPLVAHPCFARPFEESCFLAAPGSALDSAEIGDVEPVQMTFHATAHARCLTLVDDPRMRWWLARCDPRRLRCAALAQLARAGRRRRVERAPAAGALDAAYALVLRSGWEGRDLAAAMSCDASPMAHLHDDAGSIVIGTRGRWLIADPGYQQYLTTSEREYTLGVAAHNAPVIDGRAQDRTGLRRFRLAQQRDVCIAEVDITERYQPELGLTRVTRTLWLAGRDLVVVADRVVGAKRSVRYHWHGHPDAGWYWEDGEALIDLDGTVLRVRTPARALDETMVERLRGSRGQLTLAVDVPIGSGVHWWVFSLAARDLPVSLERTHLRVGARRFPIPGEARRAGPRRGGA